jgi:hypothetical protein
VEAAHFYQSPRTSTWQSTRFTAIELSPHQIDQRIARSLYRESTTNGRL